MRHDLNELFEDLFIKYKIPKLNSDCAFKNDSACNSYKENCLQPYIYKKVNQIFNDFPVDAIVAVRGMGRHTRELLKILTEESRRRIDFFIDVQPFETDNEPNKPIITIDEINNTVIDYFVISSYYFGQEMKAELMNLGYSNGAIIDLYEIFEIDGVRFDRPFYVDEMFYCAGKLDCESLSNMRYAWAIEARRCYQKALLTSDDLFIKISLYKLILTYLNIKDFMNAKKYIEEYATNQYSGYKSLLLLIKDVDDLLFAAKQSIAEKADENMIIYLIDSLESGQVNRMEYLSSLKNESLVFNNSFSQYYHTTGTIQTMFTGLDLIDERAYENDHLTYENSAIMRQLKENGYQFFYIHPYGSRKRGLIKLLDICHDIGTDTLPEQMWNLICTMASYEGKAIFFIHILEAHAPFMCGYSDFHYQFLDFRDAKTSLNEKALLMINSLKYIDEQFKFYNELVSDYNKKIFMSDHGNMASILYNMPLFDDPYRSMYYGCKTTLFITGNDLEKKAHDGLFSLNNFHKLIEFLMGLREDADFGQEYSKLQLLPYYNEARLLSGVALPLPQKGIITKRGVYTIDYKGNESYLIAPNDDRIDDIAYKETIENLRMICGSDFHDIFEQPKFEYAKKVYTDRGYI